MARNKLYRNFIILQEDEKYKKSSLNEKALSGYAKIEAKGDKCKITFYAQNLKKDDNYAIVLICNKKDMKQIIDMGSIVINNVGKGEACVEYFSDDIGGLSLSYDKISGAAVCKKSGEKLDFLMYGFINGEKYQEGWKNFKVLNCDDKGKQMKQKEYIKKSSDKKDHEEKHDKDDCYKMIHEEKHDKDDCKKKDYEEKHEDNCKKKDYEEKHDEYDCKDKDYKEKHDKDECHKKEQDSKCKCIDREPVLEKFENYERNIEQNLDPYDFKLRGGIGDFFENLVKGFEEVKGEFKGLPYCKWFKVPVKDIEDMCAINDYNKYSIIYYPMLNYYPYINKHGYFMMGYKCDSKGNLKYLVYAIPGKKDKDEQPYGGKSGFVTWCKKKDEDIGFWLMFYDYKNSTIVVPSK
ncbi:hypothetical protein ACFO6R_04355 [Eubacterium multiforme]|uniref:Transmembrane protein n=1 Tax=Eubacterium multiforme TaxID=83339 RepID=A0ABT9UV62_9FIRM|nr:hypothetical protein [Eubacterium multiforme]MDQ0150210.1 hypothetical protein [Eubacterium multiforme]